MVKRGDGTFVMGGKDALEGLFPWAVALYRDNELEQPGSLGSSYVCTGTLITKRHVMTAAHCFDTQPDACRWVVAHSEQSSSVHRS